MAAAGRSRAQSARPGDRRVVAPRGGDVSAFSRREAEAREAAAAVAALPERLQGVGIARENGREALLPRAAAGRSPPSRGAESDPAHAAPVRPLWPSRPSTAAARVGANADEVLTGKSLVRPSSAAALRRAAALCAEIERAAGARRETQTQNPRGRFLEDGFSSAADTALLAPPLVPLAELEEPPAGAYAAASLTASAPFGGEETFFAAVAEERGGEARVSFRGGRLTVAPEAADGPEGDEGEGHDGDALARALRLCHSAAETAAGVAERLRSRDAAGDKQSELSAEEDAVAAAGHRSGDENDAPTSPAPASSPRRAPSAPRPGSAFGERSVRSSLERFRRRRSASEPEQPRFVGFAEKALRAEPALSEQSLRNTSKDEHRRSLLDSASEDSGDVDDVDDVVEAILQTLLDDTAESARDAPLSGAACPNESDDDADDVERARRVEALVAEMSATESHGSRLIGAEAFGRLYDALARRAEAAAAAAAALRETDDFGGSGSDSSASESESESASESESDSGRSDSSPKGGWSATLGPFASSVTVAMTPRRRSRRGSLGSGATRETGARARRTATTRFAEAEDLALRYAHLVSELEQVGRSREGTPEGETRDGIAVRLAAGGPTGKP